VQRAGVTRWCKRKRGWLSFLEIRLLARRPLKLRELTHAELLSHGSLDLRFRDTAVGLAFGRLRGLVVWQTANGLTAIPMDSEGAPTAHSQLLPLSPPAAPIDVVPVTGGFVVLSQIVAKSLCPTQCVDPACLNASNPGINHVCFDGCWRSCDGGKRHGFVSSTLCLPGHYDDRD
jgi:hypothetical protein